MKLLYRPNAGISAMANYYPKHTGLPMVIWIDSLGVSRKSKHNQPRIKVQNVLGDKVVDDSFSLSISKNPEVLAGKCKLKSRDFQAVQSFVAAHYDDLMDHWNHEIDDFELKDRLA